jgi:hypothetical protein
MRYTPQQIGSLLNQTRKVLASDVAPEGFNIGI